MLFISSHIIKKLVKTSQKTSQKTTWTLYTSVCKATHLYTPAFLSDQKTMMDKHNNYLQEMTATPDNTLSLSMVLLLLDLTDT